MLTAFTENENNTLCSLTIDYNNIGDNGTEILSSLLANFTALAHLSIVKNNISDSGLIVLSEGLCIFIIIYSSFR